MARDGFVLVVCLAAYRAKYALYAPTRRSVDLHARFPMVAIWDDRDVQDDCAGGAH